MPRYYLTQAATQFLATFYLVVALRSRGRSRFVDDGRALESVDVAEALLPPHAALVRDRFSVHVGNRSDHRSGSTSTTSKTNNWGKSRPTAFTTSPPTLVG
jgi:hypothetical protein